MKIETGEVVRTLRAAREGKGLSQRALSEKVGVPQAHISKIEKGAVDLRLSSLVALARVLDLELTLVPRKAVSAVRSVIRGSEPVAAPSGDALKEIERFRRTLASVSGAIRTSKELAQIQRQFRDLQHFQLAKPQIESLKDIEKAVRAFRDQTTGMDALRQAVSRIQDLRNAVAHAAASLPRIEPVRPAYTLDEEGGDA
jgi:transcriptional regulator with XRE-family HTH domain